MSARILTETPRRGKAHRLERTTFKTSRLLDFVGERELTAQIGHPADEWPAVILKELMDNAIDACEEAEVAPSLSIAVSSSKGTITITDNGPGIDTATVTNILDYTVRVSSREAYVSPTRGAQGNALKTILAMGFALTGERGETIIESRGTRHRIVFAVDRIRKAAPHRADRIPVFRKDRHRDHGSLAGVSLLNAGGHRGAVLTNRVRLRLAQSAPGPRHPLG